MEDEGEAALITAMVPLALVAMAIAANVIRHFAVLVVAGCTAEVVPTIAPVAAVLSLSMKWRGRHLRYDAREHVSRPPACR